MALLAAPDVSARPCAAVQCPPHRVKQVSVPWARPESGGTLMLNKVLIPKVIETKYPQLTKEEQKQVLQRVVVRGVALAVGGSC